MCLNEFYALGHGFIWKSYSVSIYQNKFLSGMLLIQYIFVGSEHALACWAISIGFFLWDSKSWENLSLKILVLHTVSDFSNLSFMKK